MAYPDAVWGRAMTVQEVVLQALSGEIHWFRALMPKMSAARNQWISPLSACSTTSCTVIARPHTASG